MSRISKEEFEKLLNVEKVSILKIKLGDKDIEINRNISIYFDFDNLSDMQNGQTIDRGYSVNCNGETTDVDDFEKICDLLDMQNVDNEKMELISINNRFDSVNDYLEDKEFNNLDMKGILNKYAGKADSFELVTPYNDKLTFIGVSADSRDNASEAVEGIENATISRLKQYYDKYYDKIIKVTDKGFDEIITDIKKEIESAIAKGKKQCKPVFMCDRVYKGKTKYSEPYEFFWHTYHDIQFMFECRDNIERAKAERELVENSIIEDLRLLQPHLISARLSYSWHCTTTSQLSIVCKFQLNEDTQKYLLRFKDDYDLRGLEDLALYSGDKLLFSSCTHEGFHTDLTKKNMK